VSFLPCFVSDFQGDIARFVLVWRRITAATSAKLLDAIQPEKNHGGDEREASGCDTAASG
jgi:hypothetical protein